MNTKFLELRNTYKEIIYRDYLVDDVDNDESAGLVVANLVKEFVSKVKTVYVFEELEENQL